MVYIICTWCLRLGIQVQTVITVLYYIYYLVCKLYIYMEVSDESAIMISRYVLKCCYFWYVWEMFRKLDLLWIIFTVKTASLWQYVEGFFLKARLTGVPRLPGVPWKTRKHWHYRAGFALKVTICRNNLTHSLLMPPGKKTKNMLACG